MEPAPYSPTVLRNLSALIRRSGPVPSVTIPISSCVICPTFSFSVIWARSFSTTAADAAGDGPAGVMLRCKNVWLSTIPAPGLSAPDGRATKMQTTSKITIWLSFRSGVVTGFSLQRILTPRLANAKFRARKNPDGGLAENWQLAICIEIRAAGGPSRVGAAAMKQTAAITAAARTDSASSAADGRTSSACCTPADSRDDSHRKDILGLRDTDTAAPSGAAAVRL